MYISSTGYSLCFNNYIYCVHHWNMLISFKNGLYQWCFMSQWNTFLAIDTVHTHNYRNTSIDHCVMQIFLVIKILKLCSPPQTPWYRWKKHIKCKYKNWVIHFFMLHLCVEALTGYTIFTCRAYETSKTKHSIFN